MFDVTLVFVFQVEEHVRFEMIVREVFLHSIGRLSVACLSGPPFEARTMVLSKVSCLIVNVCVKRLDVVVTEGVFSNTCALECSR